MRVPTLALATVAAIAGQDMGQEAQAKPIPQDWHPPVSIDMEPSPLDEVKETVMQSQASNRMIATSPEVMVDPEFAMERSLPDLTSFPDQPERMAERHSSVDRAIATSSSVGVATPEATSEAVQSSTSPGAIAPPEAWAPAAIQPIVASEPVSVAQSRRVSEPITVAQTRQFNYVSPGVNRRRVRVGQLTTIQVTNRAGRAIEIELVGRTRPLLLLPGQTRRLRVDPRDLSLLYWVPGRQGELDATVSQPSLNTIVVNIFPSRFPNGNLAIYLPEPDNRPDVLRVF